MLNDETLKIQDEILEAALPNVVFDGWSWEMMCASAVEAGHSENVARGVFPEKMVGVMDHFADWADRQMLMALQDINPEDLRIRDRIRVAVLARFEVLNSYKDAVDQSLHFWIWPTRKLRAAKITWRTADVIWNWAGDDARDYNRYTKRGLLSGVIASTTIAWLNDASTNMDKTKSFLDRRIENVMKLGKVIHSVQSKASL